MSRTASAYPTALVFAPTGDALPGGMVNVYAYVPVTFRPSVGPSATWIGIQAGLVPEFAYSGDLRFGGVELGVDVINGAPHSDGTTYSKPIFNAKVNLLAQTDHVPAVGLGFMSFAPFQSSESTNFAYLSATKSLSFCGTEFGKVTLGLAWAAFASSFAFQGSPPLRNSAVAVLGGYVTPQWRHLSIAIDTLGGVSDASSSNLAISYAPGAGVELMVGVTFTNDRDLPRDKVIDSVFANLSFTFDTCSSSTDRDGNLAVCPHRLKL